MKKRSALIFGLLAALLALGMAVTGCSNGSTDDGGSSAWPEAWGGQYSTPQTWGTEYPLVKTWNGTADSNYLYYYTSAPAYTVYKLQSFTGDGTSTGSFKVKKIVQAVETGDELTVTYSLSGSVLTLVSTAITEFGSEGATFTKVTD